MPAPTSPESVNMEVTPEVLLPDDDEEFTAPDLLLEGNLGYRAVVEDSDGMRHQFSASIEMRSNPTDIDGEPFIRESTRFTVSGPEIVTDDGKVSRTNDSRYSVIEIPEAVPPRTQEQKEAILRSMVAHIMSVE